MPRKPAAKPASKPAAKPAAPAIVAVKPREEAAPEVVAEKPAAAAPSPVAPPVTEPVAPALSPQTLEDLERLGLEPRLPGHPKILRALVAQRMVPDQWSWDHAASYRRLLELVTANVRQRKGE